MSNYTIFKPNAKSSGGLASFRVSQTKKGEDLVAQLFVELVPQSGWDAGKRTGSFDNSKKKCVMFNIGEAGEMIACIKNGYPWQAFHKSASSSTQITFGPWKKTHEIGKQGGQGHWKGEKNDFVLSVYSDGVPNRITATAGEAECLLILLQDFVRTATVLDGKNHERKFKASQENK